MSHGERGAEQFKVDVVDMSSPDRRGDGSTQTTVPTRQLSSNFREQLREYRRENDLCFYCGSAEHSLRECSLAPHNRTLVVRNKSIPSLRSQSSRISLASKISSRSSDDNETTGPPTLRANTPMRAARNPTYRLIDNELIARGAPMEMTRKLDGKILKSMEIILETQSVNLSQRAWLECLNAVPPPGVQLDESLKAQTLDESVDALWAFVNARFISTRNLPAVENRCPTPSIEPDEEASMKMKMMIRQWEAVPAQMKPHAIEELKKQIMDKKISDAIDLLGDYFIHDRTPPRVVNAFQLLVQYFTDI